MSKQNLVKKGKKVMEIKKNVVVRIAGAAGDGIASSGEIFGKACSRQGLHVMAYNAYQSAIRGGHVWLQLNVGSEKTLSHGEKVDLLVLLKKPVSYFRELRRLTDLLYPLQLESDQLISAKPVDYTAFDKGDLQLYRNAKKYGMLV